MLSSVSSPIVGIGELLWDLLPSGPRLGGAPTNFSTLSARLGDYVQAYEFSQRAGVSRETSRSQEARNRAVAEKQRADTEAATAA